MSDFGTLSKANSYDANVRWLASRPWIRVVTAQQVADNQISYVGQDGDTHGTWGTETRGTGQNLEQTAKDYVDWATGESYDNWYNKLRMLNFTASSPFGQVNVDGHADAAWDAVNTVTVTFPTLQKVARAAIGSAMFQTAFYEPHTNQVVDLRKFSTGDYINPASLSNQSLANFAKVTQGQARFAKIYERVQTWALAANGTTRSKEQLDVDLDGADEYLLYNSRIFAVFEAKGGRMTAAWLRDPANGRVWQVAGNFASYSNTETEDEGASNFIGSSSTLNAYRTSGFKDWWATGGTFGGGNNNAVNASYTVSSAGDAAWTFSTAGISKTISLPDTWSGNISAAYTLTGPSQLYVRFGLSPNLLDLMKNGHANLGNEQLVGNRVNLVNTNSVDGPVRAFVQASANSSINSGASDKDLSGITTVNRRNQAQTHQVEVAITGNTTITLGFDQGSDIQQPADTDGDGMDDSWEMANFGNLGRDGSGDADGDGLTDLQEFILLSNPNSASSGYPAVGVGSISGGFRITFATQLGRNYQVQVRDNLSTGAWANAGSVIAGNGSDRTYDDLTTPSRRFYRVVVSKP